MVRDFAITCNDISKSFILEDGGSVWRLLFNGSGAKKFEALRSVTIEAPKGEFIGLLGRNGAGKSTLLRTLGGVFSPDTGVVHVSGDVAALFELGVTGNDHLKGRDFAHRWLDVFAGSRAGRNELIDDIHDFSELGDAFDREIRGYSAGMKARLFFAIATARRADVFVIDEVLSVGDEYFQNKCWRRMRRLLGNGASGIIATHDWSAILRLCATSYIIERGRTIFSGPSPAAVREYLGTGPQSFVAGAKLDPSTPAILTAQSLEPFSASFFADVQADGPLGLAASVESFHQGFGWEHVLHLGAAQSVVGPGSFEFCLSVDSLPLPPGRYTFNVSLIGPRPNAPALIYDARGWTSGNAIELQVTGTSSQAALRVPLSARILDPT